MRKRKISSLLSMTMLSSVMVLTACGGSNESTSESSAADGGDKALKVAMVYSGNLGDQSYNDSANSGAKKAADDFGVEIKTLEGTTPEVWESNLLAAADAGYDLVITTSSNFEEYLKEIAPQYPDVKFGIIDTVVEGDNVQSISYAQNEGSFLAGVAAATFTKSQNVEGINEESTIGFVGGMDIPVIQDFLIGYEQGAKYVDPNIKVLTSFAGSWNDPLKGKELTLAQYEQGADIVFNVASGTGPGILEAAAEAGKYAIGVDLNQDNDQPGSILTSMMKRVDTAVYTLIEDVVNDEFEGNTTLKLGLDNGGVGLTDFAVIKEHLGDAFPQEVIDAANAAAEKIASGEIKVENAPGFGTAE